MLGDTSKESNEGGQHSGNRNSVPVKNTQKRNAALIVQPNIRSFVNKKYSEYVSSTLKEFKVDNKTSMNEQLNKI